MFKKKILFLFSIGEILKHKSLSLLDFQDFEKKFSFSSRWMRFLKTNLFLFSIFKILETKRGRGLSLHLKGAGNDNRAIQSNVAMLSGGQNCNAMQWGDSYFDECQISLFCMFRSVIIVTISNSKKSNTWKSSLTRLSQDVGMLWYVKVVGMICIAAKITILTE